MAAENELGTLPVKKLLAKLAMPAIAAQVVNLLYNVVDRIYIGHIPETGKLSLTGLGVCMPLILLISAFAALAAYWAWAARQGPPSCWAAGIKMRRSAYWATALRSCS